MSSLRHLAGRLAARLNAEVEPGQWSKAEILARLRGQQTIRRLRALGVNAPQGFYIASRLDVDAGFAWAVTIGANATLSHDVRIIAHDAAMFHLIGYTLVRPVVIGANSYIGAGTTILPGSVVGDDAVIGAASLVRGEIPPGAVAVGNPARVIGDVEGLRERHLNALESIPRFETPPAAPGGGLSADERAAMEQALAAHGRLYVR